MKQDFVNVRKTITLAMLILSVISVNSVGVFAATTVSNVSKSSGASSSVSTSVNSNYNSNFPSNSNSSSNSTFTSNSTSTSTSSASLTALLNQVRSMKANFTQTVFDNHGKATQKSYGKMAMQRPGKFRWDVSKPIPQLIIANQNKLWIYDPDLQQVTIRAFDQSAGESPALLLSHDNESLEKNFTVSKQIPSQQSRPSKQQWFSLTPKHRGNMFESIQMGFANNQIQEMKLKDNLGHITVVQFQDIQVNVNTPASLFNFKSSPKIDVIDETKKHEI